jgi:hypothetical protein
METACCASMPCPPAQLLPRDLDGEGDFKPLDLARKEAIELNAAQSQKAAAQATAPNGAHAPAGPEVAVNGAAPHGMELAA